MSKYRHTLTHTHVHIERVISSPTCFAHSRANDFQHIYNYCKCVQNFRPYTPIHPRRPLWVGLHTYIVLEWAIRDWVSVCLCAKWTFDFTGCCFLPVFFCCHWWVAGDVNAKKKCGSGWHNGGAPNPRGFGVHTPLSESFFSSFWAFEFSFILAFFLSTLAWCLPLVLFRFLGKATWSSRTIVWTVSTPGLRWSITAIYLTAAGQVRDIPTEIRLQHADAERFIMAKIMMLLPACFIAGKKSEHQCISCGKGLMTFFKW